MENIRVRVSIRLNQNHALSEQDLERLKPVIERGYSSLGKPWRKLETTA